VVWSLVIRIFGFVLDLNMVYSETPNPKTQNTKPKTQNPKPKTQNPKPKTQNPKPKTQNRKHDVAGIASRRRGWTPLVNSGLGDV